MSHSVLLRLNDIIRAIDGATATVGSADFQTFRSTYHIIRTAERSIEIVSEATRHIPDHLKIGHSHIPWREIAGIGNILRHDYDRIDDHILWEIVTIHFAALRQVVVHLREEIGKSV
jgi:uncharacterized protein with HEPN domain